MEFLFGTGAKFIQNENTVLLLTVLIVLASLGAFTESLAMNGNMEFTMQKYTGIFVQPKLASIFFFEIPSKGQGGDGIYNLITKKYMQDDRKTRIWGRIQVLIQAISTWY